MHQVVSESIVFHHTSQTAGRLDKDMDNSKLLFTRKPRIIPDAHLYYTQDGYMPALTKEFVLYPRLTEEKRKEFNKTVLTQYSDKLCMEYLLKEPFWHDGYHILIQSLVKQEKILEAIAYCQKAANVCYSRHTIALLIGLASKLDDKTLYENVKNSLKNQLNNDIVNVYKQKFHHVMQGDSWHDKLLATQELDTDEFGVY